MCGIILKRQSLDVSHAKKYIGFSYMHQVLQAQAMIAGSTLCTSKIICYVGPPAKSRVFMTKGNSDVKGKPYFHPMSRVYQLKERIKIIYDITNEKRTQRTLLNQQRKAAASLLVTTFLTSSNSFLEMLPLILDINELVKSPIFWITILLQFVRKLLSAVRKLG